MSKPSKRQVQQVKVRLVGRGIGLLEIAQDVLAGAHQLQLREGPSGRLWRARRHLRQALKLLAPTCAADRSKEPANGS